MTSEPDPEMVKFTARSFASPRFFRDVKTLCSVDLAALRVGLQRLARDAVFLDRQKFVEILVEGGQTRDTSSTIWSFVVALHYPFEGGKDPRFVRSAMLQAVESETSMGAKYVADLRPRLEILVDHAVPAVVSQLKAEELAQAIGSIYYEHRFVCDARPVFDESRDDILGLFPVTTLRIRSRENMADIDTVVDVVLTEAQLDQLVNDAVQAQKKLRMLKSLLGSKSITVPRIPGASYGEEAEGS